jgi:ABC-type phosphate transport system substrate-binding protein
MGSSTVKFSICFALFIAIINSAYAELVVIVHPQNDVKITPKNVQRIFLGKEKKFSNGLETIPINQVHGSSARELFDNNRLDRSSTQISAYWSKFVFTGKGVPPIEVSDDASVVDLVANNKNAIGYIEESQISDKVTSIKINE